MNRGYKKYHKEASLKARKSFKKIGNLVNYYTYFLTTFVLRIVLFVLSPLFRVHDHRLSRMVRNEEEIQLNRAFAKGDNFKNVWSSIHVFFQLFNTALFRIIIIALPFGALYYLGYDLIIYFRLYSIGQLIEYTSLIVGGILVLIFLFKFIFEIQPIFYLMESLDDYNSSDIIERSKRAVKYEGKATMFANFFWPGLEKVLLLALPVIPFVVFQSNILSRIFLPEYARLFDYLCLTLSIILLFVFLRIAPVLTLTTRISNEMLFDDLLYGKATAKNIHVGRKMKKAMAKKLSKADYQEKLRYMFDEQVEINEFKDDDIKTIDVLKNNEETSELFEDARVVDFVKEETSTKVSKSSFQKEFVSSNKQSRINNDTANSINDLLKEDTKAKDKSFEETLKEDTLNIDDVVEEVKETAVQEEKAEVLEKEANIQEPKEEAKETIKEEIASNLNEEVKEEVTIEKPRKGRPKKSESIIPSEDDSKEKTETLVETTENKPKRGRPKKKVVESEEETNNE